ncbi:alpha/beta fold hydrolase [Pseudohalioglobus sediminis]|uniref:Alpha/beta fold hydrolase n=1 Tax=Pseudohalioglobus sediminis TaxID=2606449 RepID=A0A5B0WPZ7_9GAMM|nr:alpha/beta fold hydrolase [Pseudohalioglobus sediminis]KAA1189130.1 alpha/beta fold hydrolase [Pseudohalioglobus sediminis]
MAECIRSTPLLLLPGMMCDAGLWRAQEAELGGELPLLHGDITGHDDIAAIARGVLAGAPERFALAGLSMGGIVALEMWRQAPERIARLALLDTNFRADTPQRRAVRDRQMAQARRGELGAILRDELKPNYLASCHRDNRALLDEVLYMGMGLGAEVFVRQSLALRDRPDSTATLPTITCPTLVLCGEEDELCPPSLHGEMAQRIPAAQLLVIPDCGHLATMEQPGAVNAALKKWLN